ncbi:MAG: VTT domain-containing protein [Rhizobiales bacterium]|nr:VTT domain-containing protein [Hyphomicrobiales bacterium]
MKHLIKVMLIIGTIFAVMFLIGRLFGILTIENIKIWLEYLHQIDVIWASALIIALLFSDLFFAVPTLTLTILAGFFLGFPLGSIVSLIGVSLATFTGYLLSWRWGENVLKILVKKQDDREDLKAAFHSKGPVMIILARAAPMIPEVTACMAGVTKMPFAKYALFHLLGTLPYILIATYAGSISTIESPQPAIIAALLLYAVMWIGWYIFRKKQKAKTT